MKDYRKITVDGSLITVESTGNSFLNSKGKQIPIQTNYYRGNRKSISINGKMYYCARLVAMAYPDLCGKWFDGCEVHHIDENPENNDASNLLVVSPDEHQLIHINFLRDWSRDNMSIPTHQYTMDGTYVMSYPSSIEAAETIGIASSAIRNCLCGISSTAGGYVWKSSYDAPDLFIEPVKPQKERFRESIGIPISQYDTDGNFIRTFGSAIEAKEYLGKTSNSIGNCLKGRTRTAFGFIWKYANCPVSDSCQSIG